MRGAWLYCSDELVDSGRPLLLEHAEAVAESRPWNAQSNGGQTDIGG